MDKNVLLELIKNNVEDDVSINDIIDELDNYLCLLTRRNADLIESFISVDPNYPHKMEPVIQNAGVFKNNSTPEEINRALTKKKLDEFVWVVASVNSIQGKTQTAKSNISNFIIEKGISFYERLKAGDLNLVEEMERHVYSKGGSKRHECSWCSKVCKFLHEFLFNNDAYYIYDNNVKARLNEYKKYYGLKLAKKKQFEVKNNEHWYLYLCQELEDLRKSLDDELKRYEIDHILWGFAKYKLDLARKIK